MWNCTNPRKYFICLTNNPEERILRDLSVINTQIYQLIQLQKLRQGLQVIKRKTARCLKRFLTNARKRSLSAKLYLLYFTRIEPFCARNYSMISVTTPEPTVLPPSRIAKRSPTSIAIGVMSSTSIITLSPGLHISTSSGSLMLPVTSVVLK